MNNQVKYSLIFIIALFLLIGFANGFKCNSSSTLTFESNWREPTSAELGKIIPVLAKKQVTECGELYVRKANGSDTEYLIACRGARMIFHGYHIFTASEEVLPYEDSAYPMPTDK